MADAPKATEIKLSFAAQRLREAYQTTRDRLLRGELRGRMIRGRWFVESADVDRIAAAKAQDDAAVAAV